MIRLETFQALSFTLATTLTFFIVVTWLYWILRSLKK